MTVILYICASRALALVYHKQRGWQLQQVFSTASEDLHALSDWLGQQRRNSVIVLLDLPGEELDVRALPSLSAWRLQLLTRNLAKTTTCTQGLSRTAVHANSGNSPVFSQLTLAQSSDHGDWLAALAYLQQKIHGLYSVAVLVQQFQLPEQPAETAELLCTTLGDGALRHCFFWQGQLFFIRQLDRHMDGDLLAQQLSDTVQFVKDRFVGGNITPGWSGKLRCYMSNDLPRTSCAGASSTDIDIVDIDAESGAATQMAALASLNLSVAQVQLFHYLQRTAGTAQLTNALSASRYNWSKAAQRRARMNVENGQDERALARLRVGLNVLQPALICFCVVFLMASTVLFQRADTLVQKYDRLENQLQQLKQNREHYSAPALAMREAVLLHRALQRDHFNVVDFLSAVGTLTGISADIQLTHIGWAFVDAAAAGSPAEHWLESPSLRATLSLDADDSKGSGTRIFAVSGRMLMSGRSVAEAYSAYQGFAAKLSDYTDLQKLKVGQVPFDSAEGGNGVHDNSHIDADRGADFLIWLHSSERASL